MSVGDIKKAILKREKSYEGIELPKPQIAGTGFQQETYAELEARKIYAKIFLINKND